MAKISIKVIILIILALSVVAGGFYYFYYYQAQENYLIPGVPYYGFYNHFFDADSTLVTSVADILGYWGDEVDLPALFSMFAPADDKEGNLVYPTTLQLQKFFQERGYETYRWASNQPGGEINEIKKFVNQDKKIPVIVYQKRSFVSDNQRRAFRVVIGLSDHDKKVTVHDYTFGNNFQISYADFNKMFLTDARAVLAVWPTSDLNQKIKGPNYSATYPGRLAVMDKMGDYLIRPSDMYFASLNKDYINALKMLQEFISDEKFNSLPPVYRLYFNAFLARVFLYLNQPDKAIETITNRVLPLNSSLDEPYDGWTEQLSYFKNNNYSRASLAYPYYVLGLAYIAEGDKELARKNFEEALKINPDSKLAQEALQQLK